MSATQAPQHAPDDAVAQVLALTHEGHSASEASRLVGVPVRTGIRWVERAREVANGNKPILDKWTRRVDQSLDLIQDGLDLIEQDESRQLALKNLQTLNIIAGTGTDKLLKSTDTSQPQNLTQVMIVLNCERPEDVIDKAKEYIEGESSEVSANGIRLTDGSSEKSGGEAQDG